jgi:hypothetical protein
MVFKGQNSFKLSIANLNLDKYGYQSPDARNWSLELDDIILNSPEALSFLLPDFNI